MSAVRDCLFNLFAATVHIGGRSSIPNLRMRHAVVTGTHKHRLSVVTGVNFEINDLVAYLVNKNVTRGFEALKLHYTEYTNIIPLLPRAKSLRKCTTFVGMF